MPTRRVSKVEQQSDPRPTAYGVHHSDFVDRSFAYASSISAPAIPDVLIASSRKCIPVLAKSGLRQSISRSKCTRSLRRRSRCAIAAERNELLTSTLEGRSWLLAIRQASLPRGARCIRSRHGVALASRAGNRCESEGQLDGHRQVHSATAAGRNGPVGASVPRAVGSVYEK